jgi:hypothetical protein
LIGNTGAGKSVLSSFIITELQKHRVTELHFFCKDRSSDSSTAAAIAANLIDQLIEKNRLKPLFNILSEARRKHAKTNTCTDFEILWNIFVAMVRAFPNHIVVVIDALDECLVDRAAFLDGLASLVKDTKGNVRFFLTSRRENDVFEKLANHSEIATRGMAVDEDIRKFVIEQVQQLPRLHAFEAQIIQEVPKYSAGMFRYAALLLEELNTPSTVDILDMLNSPPRDLDDMYERILLRLEAANNKQHVRELRKKILYWVAFAKTPLEPTELALFCAVNPDETDFDPARRVLATESELLRTCGPLIEIMDGKVQFTHLSVKEFLIQTGKRDGRVDDYLVQEPEAHASIAITCGR